MSNLVEQRLACILANGMVKQLMQYALFCPPGECNHVNMEYQIGPRAWAGIRRHTNWAELHVIELN